MIPLSTSNDLHITDSRTLQRKTTLNYQAICNWHSVSYFRCLDEFRTLLFSFEVRGIEKSVASAVVSGATFDSYIERIRLGVRADRYA